MRGTVVLVQLLALTCAAPMVNRASDESLHKFEELKTRLEELKEVLKNLGQELEKTDVEHTKRNQLTKPNEELSDEVQEIVDKISPDDLRLLKEYSNKAHYFLKAVKDNPGGLEPDPPKEPPQVKPVPPKTKPAESEQKPDKPQTEPAKRNQDAELENYISGLSEEDQNMLRGMESRLHYLKTALHTPPGENESDKKAEGEPANQHENREISKDLQPEDIELLQKLKERLKYIKSALKEQKVNVNQEKVSKNLPEGVFGDFVKREDVKRGHWEDKALLDSDLGAQQNEEKRCGAGDKRCEDEDEDSKEDFVAEAEQRFVKDVDFARQHGVKITDLLRALKARKVEQLRREEKELEELRLHD